MDSKKNFKNFQKFAVFFYTYIYEKNRIYIL